MALGKIAIIGGTGIGEALSSFGHGTAHDIDTPFGKPSSQPITIDAPGLSLVLLKRHGEGHLLNPSQVPYRANIFALKLLGVTHVIATGAVGSLREQIAPRHLVVLDQTIDRTVTRANTFFDSLAAHVELSSPFCSTLRSVLLQASAKVSTTVHEKGTYVCMEGPAFSTRAESAFHRLMGGDLVGMTLLPEAKLAREAELCYAAVALATDYDSWKPHSGALTSEQLLTEIISHLKVASANAMDLIKHALPTVVSATSSCSCQSALALGLWSDKTKIPAGTKEKLRPLLSKYI